MNIAEIRSVIYEILSRIKSGISSELLEKGKDKMLSSSYWGLSAIDMVYFFLEIEKEFAIEIDAKKIINYEFSTIDGIVKIVNKELVKNKENKLILSE